MNTIELTRTLRTTFPRVLVAVNVKPGQNVMIESLEVPEELRGRGIGSDCVREIQRWAAIDRLPVVLVPSGDGGHHADLVRFYQRLHFVWNRGLTFRPEISDIGCAMWWSRKLPGLHFCDCGTPATVKDGSGWFCTGCQRKNEAASTMMDTYKLRSDEGWQEREQRLLEYWRNYNRTRRKVAA